MAKKYKYEIGRMILSIVEVPEDIHRLIEAATGDDEAQMILLTTYLDEHKAWPPRSDSTEDVERFEFGYTGVCEDIPVEGTRGKKK